VIVGELKAAILKKQIKREDNVENRITLQNIVIGRALQHFLAQYWGAEGV